MGVEQMEHRKFTMSEPQKHDTVTTYAFSLTATDDRLAKFVEGLICVAAVDRVDTQRVLVSIYDEYDADEAWHYIRTELESEAQLIFLDQTLEDARWL